MRISEFLVKLLSTSPCFIDFFLEAEYSKYLEPSRGDLSSSGEITQLERMLEPCLRVRGKDCPYPARIHYGDPRLNIAPESEVGAYCQKNPSNFAAYSTYRFEDFLAKKDKIKYLFERYGHHHLFEKEMSKAASPHASGRILSLLQEYYKRTIPEIDAISPRELQVLKLPPDTEVVDKVRKICSMSSKYFAWMFDYYVISRLLKKFHEVEDTEGVTTHPRTIHHAIVYSGGFHSRTIKEILVALGYRVLAEETGVWFHYNCLSLKKLQWPIFQC